MFGIYRGRRLALYIIVAIVIATIAAYGRRHFIAGHDLLPAVTRAVAGSGAGAEADDDLPYGRSEPALHHSVLPVVFGTRRHRILYPAFRLAPLVFTGVVSP
ncbi:hypothetical protein L1887_43925 [Cichorium endivia]|nr:hypothetical protein L1887_43925 [Cichorium endivia]